MCLALVLAHFKCWVHKHVEMHLEMCVYRKEKKGNFSSCENRIAISIFKNFV